MDTNEVVVEETVAAEPKTQTLVEALAELVQVPEDKVEQLDALLSRIISEKVSEFLGHKDNRILLAQSVFAAGAGAIGDLNTLRRKLSDHVPVVKRLAEGDVAPEGAIRATFTTGEIGGVVLEAIRNGQGAPLSGLPADVENGYRAFAWKHWNSEPTDVIYITFERQETI